ncbi:MAG: DUF1579 domain-containing protein [Burkholderiales bacterium]|nr:DUF1579 domain-containing protein [Burkholderiales bacterium]
MLRLLFASALVAAVAAHAAEPASAQDKPAVSLAAAQAAQCPDPAFRQFDFWIGDWDTFESDLSVPKSIARTRVKPIAARCAIHELYEQTDGLIGDSILSYDPVRKVWQQTWVDNRGTLIVVSGAFKDGTVTMEGEMRLRSGKMLLQRITWKAEADAVREFSTRSKDGGKTWEPFFDVLFRKRK